MWKCIRGYNISQYISCHKMSSSGMGWAKEETIQKYFRKAGVLNNDLAVQSCDMETDLLLECDMSLSQSQVDFIVSGTACSIDEYINGDANVPVCFGMDDDNWEETFFSQLKIPILLHLRKGRKWIRSKNRERAHHPKV